MKPIVILLALLAAVKLGHQEYLFRSGTREAIVGAYMEQAAQACQKNARAANLAMSAHAWANPASVRLVIGKGNLDVSLWQVDHALWNARYRNPYLLLTAGESAGGALCEYDIVNAAAAVHRM
jgi:hypothetical protein